jgi:hypothetical protein
VRRNSKEKFIVEQKLIAALEAALGATPTHVVKCSEGVHIARDGARHGYAFFNHICPTMLHTDPKDAVRFRAQGNELAPSDQIVLAACLESGKSTSIMFSRFIDAHDFIGECFDAVE